MESSNPIWTPKTIPNAGNIGKVKLGGDIFFEGRVSGDEIRAKASIKYLIEKVYQNTSVKLKPADILRLKLGHTNIVKKFTKDDIQENFELNDRGVNVSIEKIDGLVMPYNCSESFSNLIGIGTADCAPIIIRSDKLVGVVHAGHQGLSNEIIANLAVAVREIEGTNLEKIRIAIAPMAEKLLFPLSFENQVPADFFNLYRDLGLIQTLEATNSLRSQIFDNAPSTEKKLYFNFIGILIHQLLEEFRISESNIELSNIDTTIDPYSYSYRRDKNDLNYSNNLSFVLG